MRFPILLLVLLLGLAACSTEASPIPDRLVILNDGAVVTVDPDGTHLQTVTDQDEEIFFQPIWSPDRSLIAFASRSAAPTINLARADGQNVFSAETGTFPFYYSFSSQNVLAILHNDTEGLRLDTTRLNGDALADLRLVETGQPLYYSWSPDGDSIAAHIGVDRMLTSDLVESTPVAFAPGAFQAPAWTDRGFLSVASGSPRHRLVLVEPDGTELSLATVDGPATFLPNRDANLVALQSTATSDGFQSAAMQALPRLPANRLVILDTETGEIQPVTNSPVLAFFWSPADDQLLVLDVVEGPQARWSVWVDGELEELARFAPEPSFVAEFLPFFDQYAQSVSLWAPDGRAIAFPGAIGAEAGIWLQPIGGEPTLISEGSWVSWAP